MITKERNLSNVRERPGKTEGDWDTDSDRKTHKLGTICTLRINQALHKKKKKKLSKHFQPERDHLKPKQTSRS